MSLQEIYKKKAETDLELAQARLAEFKVKVKSAKTDEHDQDARQVEALEHGVDDAKAKLKALGNADEDAWEHMKDGVESALHSLGDSIRKITNKFKD